MLNFKKTIQLIFIVISLSFYSCEKTPGEGGNARIRGKVWVKQYDPFFTILESEYYGTDENVQITYGDNLSSDKTNETNSNGGFDFQYLRKGKYTITVYSKVLKDADHPSGIVAVDTVINITKRKQTIDIGTLTIQK